MAAIKEKSNNEVAEYWSGPANCHINELATSAMNCPPVAESLCNCRALFSSNRLLLLPPPPGRSGPSAVKNVEF